MKDVFCDNCWKNVKYNIKHVIIKITIGEKEIQYEGKEAICRNCNEPIFLEHIFEYNQEQLNKIINKDK